MSFLQRTGHRFAASAVMVACFAASSAFAAMLATNDFETSFADFTTDEELATLATYDEPSSGSDPALYPFGNFGSKYLAVDSDTTTIWRAFGTQSASTYFDSYVQFTPMYGDFEYPDDAKFLIYLDSETNLCVISGTAADNRTPVTNTLVAATVEPNSWGRLTVRAISGSVFSFQVLLNGTLLKTANDTDTFYSLTAGTTLSNVGFSGTGALDNFAVRTTDPFFSGTVAATIGGENGEKYASLEDALAEADADTVVTLAADHAGKVYLADAATFKIDNSGGYAFGGVVGANGYKVTAGEPVAGVTTYTATDAFASQPSPVVVWDGSSENYDFNTLTRTVGANTYTLNLNEQNAVGGEGAYVQIGSDTSKKALTLTAQNSTASITNGFGTSGALTVVIRYRDMPVSAGSYRAILNLMDGGKYKYGSNGSDNGSLIGLYHNSSSCGFTWKGSAAAIISTSTIAADSDVRNTVNGALTDGDQTIALTYSSTGGTVCYIDGKKKITATSLRSSLFTTPCGIALGGVDVDNSSQFYAMTDMKITAVAVFTSTLSSEQVAAWSFPSQRIAEDITVSEINAIFGGAGEIWLNVADGVTITGDTTFNATTVHFASAGEVVLYPPAGNAATLDFSGVTKPVVAYNGVLPTQSGSTFTSMTVPTWVTDAEQWTGTVWIKNYAGITGNNFLPNNYGNDSSTLRLTGISGWIWSQTSNNTINPAVELYDDGGTYGLCLSDGYGYGGGGDYFTIFSELKGTGTLVAYDKASYVLLNVRKWDDFSGTLSLTNKIVCFGSTIPASSTFTSDNGGRSGGFVWVTPDATLDIPSSWHLGNATSFGNVVVEGTLSYASLAKLSATAKVVLRDSGKINVPGTASAADFAKDFAKVSGTGTLLLTPNSASSWIGLPTNNLSTALGVEITQGSLVVPPDAANTSHATNVFEIGSLSGSGTIQGNYGDYYAYRKLRIFQSTNTEWSGTINADGYNRLYEFAVAPGASAGTLTISGNNSNKDTILTVESGAKVDLTGTWKGTVTVAGTLGVTGTVSGDLTLSDGATLKVNDRSNTLSVNNLTVSGTVSVYLPATAAAGDTFLSTSAMPTFSDAAFNIYVGETLDASLRVIATSNGLKIAPKAKGAKFFFH